MTEWYWYVFTFLAIIGTWLNAKQNIKGFYFWVIANLALLIQTLSAGIYNLAVLYLIYLFFAIYGIFNWRNKDGA